MKPEQIKLDLSAGDWESSRGRACRTKSGLNRTCRGLFTRANVRRYGPAQVLGKVRPPCT